MKQLKVDSYAASEKALRERKKRSYTQEK